MERPDKPLNNGDTMYKFMPATYATPAVCVFDETTRLVKYTTADSVNFLHPNFKVALKVPKPRTVRLAVCETLNNIYLYVGRYYTIAFRRRTRTFELIGGHINPLTMEIL